MNNEIITYWDWLLAPFYIIVIYIVASRIKNNNIKKNSTYKYFLWGLFAKIFGAICLCLIYVYYYKEGGDTLAYQSSAKVLVNLLFDSPLNFFKVFFGDTTPENYSYFNSNTGYPEFWIDTQTFNVVRLCTFFELFACKSYLVTSIIVSVISFTGVWKLYLLFCELYPVIYRQLALSVLFIPSLVFWGSGMLKDSWTLSAACWFCVSFYKVFIRRENIIYYVISMIISVLILTSIKPYIFIGIFPGCLLWLVWGRITKITNLFLRILAGPVIVSFGVSIGVFAWISLSSGFGEYSSIDKIVMKAHISSEDLKQEHYHGNSFDIGSYDPTLQGMLSKFPEATIAGLFRPFLWEAKNIVMILSGIENLMLLLFAIYCILKKPVRFFTFAFSDPLVLFCLSFAIIFAFSVAISTSNFGALVRLRIPLLPFFLSGLFMIHFNSQKENVELKKTKSVYPVS